MFRKRRDNLSCRAMTLLEMILAMSIVAVIFAALLPQFRVVLNSWATREGTAESLQNARVLIDHINRNLSKATKITAVSDSTTTSGYIEYEDADGDTFRYDVGGTNYVRFGEVGDVDDLAGPVSQFQFTCYSLDDLDTPITNVDYIRCVEYQTTVVNSSALGQDKSFTGWVFLQTNQTSATQGPIMWLKLDETSGTTATDSSGNGNDGTLTYMSGNEWTAGQIDGALELDGSNDYVNVGDAASLDITDAITVTAWIKPNASQSGYKRLIEKHYASSWYFGYSSGANGLSTYINGGQRALTSTGILTVGEWNHVAFTYDKDAGGTDEVKMYLNGAVRATGNYSSAIGTDNRDIAIGRYKYGSGYAFNGSIDDVRIYNSALSAEDVAALAGVLEAHYEFDDDTYSGPIIWLKLDETSGTTATDSSGNGNDGTLTYMSGNEWTAGQIDGALELDGSNDYVNVGDAASLDITDAITVTAWIKPNASQSGYKRLIEKHYASSWYFGYSSGANGLSTYINGGQRALTSTGILTVGEWNHVAFTYDKDAGGTDEVKMYLNGAVRATGNYSSAIGTDNRDIAIGRYKYGSGYAFNGSIDDVRIYNSARSAEDVAIILAGGTLTHTPSQTATDSSANGNDATLGTTDQSDDRDPSWVAGVVGTGSLSFDGEDDYAHTADSDTLLLLSGDYSISVWIKADASQEQWAGIYAKTNSGGTKNHWTLQFNDSGSRKIVVRHDGNNSWDTKMKLSDIAGDWHKVQISRTGATMSAYLDGVLIESGTFNYDPTSDPGHLNIGAGRTASNVFKGQIDDLRIYDLPEDTVSGGILP